MASSGGAAVTNYYNGAGRLTQQANALIEKVLFRFNSYNIWHKVKSPLKQLSYNGTSFSRYVADSYYSTISNDSAVNSPKRNVGNHGQDLNF